MGQMHFMYDFPNPTGKNGTGEKIPHNPALARELKRLAVPEGKQRGCLKAIAYGIGISRNCLSLIINGGGCSEQTMEKIRCFLRKNAKFVTDESVLSL